MMKSLLILGSLALVSVADAKPGPQFKLHDTTILARSRSFQDPSTPGNPGGDSTTPIRQAKMKVAITKFIFEKVNGTYTHRSEPVCAKTVSVDVYDLRNSVDPIVGVLGESCSSTVDGKPVSVSFGGVVTLAHGAPFPGDAPVDTKNFGSFMWVGFDGQMPAPQTPPSLQDGLFQSSWTRDLNQKYFGAYLAPAVYTMCIGTGEPGRSEPIPSPARSLLRSSDDSSCSTNYPEYFSALVEIED